MFQLPIYDFETIEDKIVPTELFFFCAILYNNLNDVRTRIISQAVEKGFNLATYISSHAFVWDKSQVEEHCFIFENNTVQPFARIERNCILWSGNHIGHHSIIKENTFISSQVVISGAVTVGKNCFIGVNSTITNSVEIGDRSWLSMGAIVSTDIPPGSLVKSQSSKVIELDEVALARKLSEITFNRLKSKL